MTFIADLHIHSKYSRATAKNLDLENLYVEARQKGITVLATGDATHPAWFAELKEKLVPAEDGLFRLKPDLEALCGKKVPPSCQGSVRFVLSSEISCIYKKIGKTRKNHNLVYFHDFDSAERFNLKLGAIGNISSDGRPILGLDARNLLEMLLETDPRAFLIPAHIWTPWFSLLGSKSGFDSVDECFEDLSSEIFAVETGLSSDPPMNHRVSFLDRFTLVSNSDAHSPAKLGREANLFNTGLSLSEMRRALQNKNDPGFLGTLEFFPEEGKYHHDGHRKCHVNLSPEQSVRVKGLCPECGSPLTLGVNYRVLQLADREDGGESGLCHPFRSIIPLGEVMAEIAGCGPQSKRVKADLATAIEKLGPELSILTDLPVADIKKAGIPLLAEAVERIRDHCLHIQPGYDGEFGVIRIFTEDEKEELLGQKMLFSFLDPEQDKNGYVKAGVRKTGGFVTRAPEQHNNEVETPLERALNPLQEQAVMHQGGPLLIVAGPGTGKTHTITRRIAHLILEKNTDPEQILAITFTSRAAGEMKNRLRNILPPSCPLPASSTIHSLCLGLLRENTGDGPLFSLVDENVKKELIGSALESCGEKQTAARTRQMAELIEKAKQYVLVPEDNLTSVCSDTDVDPLALAGTYRRYQDLLLSARQWDFDDLVCETVRRLESDPAFLQSCRARFSHVFVDEYQDLNHGQYRLIRALAPEESNITVIGDPDQAIYGFRGSDSSCFSRFKDDYPGAGVIRLTRNYRSAENILEASGQLIGAGPGVPGFLRTALWSGITSPASITVLENPTEKSEAAAIGKRIEQMMGGTGFHSLDFQTKTMLADENLGFSDFAVLTRTAAQGKHICEMFEKGGIPCQHVNREQLLNIPAVSVLLTFLKCVGGAPCSALESQALKTFLGDWQRKNLEKLAALTVVAQIEQGLDLMPDLGRVLSSSNKTKLAVQRLMAMARPFGNDTADYLKTLYLSSDQDLYDLSAERVSVMTMHAAKGLEFKVVFIAGCENGLVPYVHDRQSPGNDDEERRLFYVAMTRAKDMLFLTFSKTRTRFGKNEAREISPFVGEMDRKLFRFEVSSFSCLTQTKKPVQLSLF